MHHHLATVDGGCCLPRSHPPLTVNRCPLHAPVDTAYCAMGFNDSKALDEKQREALFRRMKATPGLGWYVPKKGLTCAGEGHYLLTSSRTARMVHA